MTADLTLGIYLFVAVTQWLFAIPSAAKFKVAALAAPLWPVVILYFVVECGRLLVAELEKEQQAGGRR